MPPKQKITKDMILEAAFQITKEKGFEGVNARSLAKVIGCSTQPIFSHYSNMADLKKEFCEYISSYYNEYVLSRAKGENFFREIGLAYIAFAKNESNLFQLLFMSERTGVDMYSDMFGDENLEVAKVVSAKAGISLEAAKNLFRKIWIFVHGIAALTATKSARLSDAETEKLMGEAYNAFLAQEKKN
ncbi:MAG: hypothetical protein K0R84_529 [Clostridia bacterium]|jgi:AcrR family transcriptional regulator|nr:hypothetical protein [Clostridia bacterium]